MNTLSFLFIAKSVICMTPVVSDGLTNVSNIIINLLKPNNIGSVFISKGSPGMKYSLISRDWVADCAEIMHKAYFSVSCIPALHCVVDDSGGCSIV